VAAEIESHLSFAPNMTPGRVLQKTQLLYDAGPQHNKAHTNSVGATLKKLTAKCCPDSRLPQSHAGLTKLHAIARMQAHTRMQQNTCKGSGVPFRRAARHQLATPLLQLICIRQPLGQLICIRQPFGDRQ